MAKDMRRSVPDGPAPYGAAGHNGGPAAVSVRVYGPLIHAFNCFNDALFGGVLPAPVITLQRKRGAGGFFHGYLFVERKGEDVLHEIALNPAGFAKLGDRSILVHEMVHEWQQVAGTPPRSIVHREWADKMIEIGLMPRIPVAPRAGRWDDGCRIMSSRADLMTRSAAP